MTDQGQKSERIFKPQWCCDVLNAVYHVTVYEVSRRESSRWQRQTRQLRRWIDSASNLKKLANLETGKVSSSIPNCTYT